MGYHKNTQLQKEAAVAAIQAEALGRKRPCDRLQLIDDKLDGLGRALARAREETSSERTAQRRLSDLRALHL